jgi:hypothetical protein
MTSPLIPGTVVWSGDNPGIYLKDGNGEWQSLAVYFRVVTSPHGSGTGMLVLGAPRAASGWPASQNLCISTNQPLMRWLVSDFVARFASFRGMPGLQAMSYLTATSSKTTGDGSSFHEETLEAAGVSASLRWEQLSTPFAADVPPAQSSTGEHRMLSVFVEAQTGSIRINGMALPGNVVERDFLGRRMKTSFLAFCETWIAPAAA